MTEVDFYVLDADSQTARWNFACRLAEKAVRQGNKVMIATGNEAESRELDQLLWSFRPESFVPHVILGDDDADSVPVIISHDGDDVQHHDVLVNIRAGLPQQFSRFKRLAEIVVQDETILRATRNNYAFYKERGYPIKTHKLKI